MRMTRVFLALFLMILWGGPATAGELDEKTKAEIKEFILKHRKAFQEKDIDTVMSMYSEDAVMMGTGPGERFEGQEEIRNAYLEYFNSFDREDYTVTWYKAGMQGDVLWATGMTMIRSYYKNELNEFPLNWSSVIVKEDGTWKFVQRHISNISCE